MTIRIEITGIKEALGKIDTENNKIRLEIAKGVEEAGLIVEAEVKLSIAGQRSEPRSVDTGRLLGSVTSYARGLIATVETDIEYAKYLEYGTVRISPRLHFRNSAVRKRQDVINAIKRRINR